MSASIPTAAPNSAADDDAPETALPSPSEVSPLDVLRAADFDWTLHLPSVWSPPRFDVEGLHADVRRELIAAVEELASNDVPQSPLGRLIVGSGGTGKTHLLSVLRDSATRRGCSFLLIDMSGIRDFSATLLQGILDSLGRPADPEPDAPPQYRTLLTRLLDTFNLTEPVSRSIDKLERFSAERLKKNIDKLLNALSRRYPAEAMQFQDALRVLIALNSRHLAIASPGMKWLQASELEPEERRSLGFTRSLAEPVEIIRGMSWLMSLCGPTVLAFDQLDPIVHELQLDRVAAEEDPEAVPVSVRTARSIVEQIAGGLSALRDVTRRTLIVVSCVESTLEVLRRHALRQDMERFEAPLMLGSLPDNAVARSVIARRLADVFERTGFSPDWPTWPFRPELFDELQGLSAREILRLCGDHRRHCLMQGQVIELASFSPPPVQPGASFSRNDSTAEAPGNDSDSGSGSASGSGPASEESASEESASEESASGSASASAEASLPHSVSAPQSGAESKAASGADLQAIDADFARLKREADPTFLLSKMHDDERLGGLLAVAFRCLLRERSLPDSFDAIVETDFGNRGLPPLHARLRFADPNRGTERHLCLRALQRDHATSFQTRLKAAVTTSGISAETPFRCLAIIRRDDPPSGPVTDQMMENFRESGGRLLSPTDDDLRSLAALQQLDARDGESFGDWLRQRRPISSLPLFEQLIRDFLADPAA